MAGSNWTQEDVDAYNLRRKIKTAESAPETPDAPVAKPRKYRNKPTEVDGIVFASKKEAARHRELKRLEKAGAIQALRTQVSFVLAPPVVLNGRRKPALKYTCDFQYMERRYDDFFLVVEDVKSPASKTGAYGIRKHLMMSVHGIEIRET